MPKVNVVYRETPQNIEKYQSIAVSLEENLSEYIRKATAERMEHFLKKEIP